MRVRSRSSCRSRVRRAWATSSSSACSSERCSVRCTVATSLTDSAIIRVSSWKRVKRSNSSGSNACDAAFAASRREVICTSPCSSMSRSWPRRRSRFSVRSASEPLIWPTPDSMRERVMLTSPAWLTRRSSSGARTRTADCVASVRSTGLARAAAARGEARPVDRRRLGRGRRRERRAARSAAARPRPRSRGASSALSPFFGLGDGAALPRRASATSGVATNTGASAIGARAGSVGRAVGATGAVAAATASE